MERKVKYIKDNYHLVLENNFDNQCFILTIAEYYDSINKLIEDEFILLDNRRHLTIVVSKFQQKWPEFINKLYNFISKEIKKLSIPAGLKE
jgi:hypothetical protein